MSAPKVSGIPGWVLRLVGLVHRGTRELAVMSYQFDRPYVFDSTASERLLGLKPTPLQDGVAATVASWT